MLDVYQCAETLMDELRATEDDIEGKDPATGKERKRRSDLAAQDCNDWHLIELKAVSK